MPDTYRVTCAQFTIDVEVLNGIITGSPMSKKFNGKRFEDLLEWADKYEPVTSEKLTVGGVTDDTVQSDTLS